MTRHLMRFRYKFDDGRKVWFVINIRQTDAEQIAYYTKERTGLEDGWYISGWVEDVDKGSIGHDDLASIGQRRSFMIKKMKKLEAVR